MSSITTSPSEQAVGYIHAEGMLGPGVSRRYQAELGKEVGRSGRKQRTEFVRQQVLISLGALSITQYRPLSGRLTGLLRIVQVYGAQGTIWGVDRYRWPQSVITAACCTTNLPRCSRASNFRVPLGGDLC